MSEIGREIWDRLKMAFLRSELARIAELEAANSELAIEALRDHRELHARVEQAELELDEMNAIHQRAQLAELAARDAIARAERAEAELKVAREALQGLCDEIELSEDHGEGAHDERFPICVAYREARASLNPPPADGLPITNGQFLYAVSRLCRTSAKAMAELAEGMWNPDFNSADGTFYALSICEDVRQWLDQVKARLASAARDHYQCGEK